MIDKNYDIALDTGNGYVAWDADDFGAWEEYLELKLALENKYIVPWDGHGSAPELSFYIKCPGLER